jgi:DnaK suppressor protein
MNGNKGNSIKTYREELLNKKVELLTSLGFNFRRLAVADRSSEDELIVALQDEFLHLGLDQILSVQLQEVESALERLNTGEYGACAECGSAISSKRLRALPWATYCVDCKDAAFAGQPQEALGLGQELPSAG